MTGEIRVLLLKISDQEFCQKQKLQHSGSFSLDMEKIIRAPPQLPSLTRIIRKMQDKLLLESSQGIDFV